MAANRLRPARDRRRSARAGIAAVGLGRVGVGLALLARPAALPRAIGVDSVSARRMAWAVRLFAVRDAALGAGALHAVLTGRPIRPWLLAQACSDGADAVTVAAAVRNRQVSGLRGAAVAAFAVGGCAGLLAALGRAEAAPPAPEPPA